MKYIISTLTTLLLFCSIAFGQTVKIGETSYNSIGEAVTAASAGDVIKITGTHTESITITKNITLQGTDPATDIIQAAATKGTADSRVIVIQGSGNDVTIENLTVRYGNATVAGGGLFIENATTLVTLKNLIVEDNASTKNGGGIMSVGANVDIEGCVIRNNTTALAGAGLFFGPKNNSGQNATVNIKASLVANNTATGNAGGLFVDGNNGVDYNITVNVENTTVAFNQSNDGGGIQVRGATHSGTGTTNTTFNLNQSTVAYNTTTNGSRHGMYFLAANNAVSARPIINLYNSIVALNTNDANTGKDVNFANSATNNLTNCIFGSLNNKNATYVANETGLLTGKTNTDIKLATSLENNVLPIEETSIAVDFADAATALATDALGNTRTDADAGAVEYVMEVPADNVFIGDVMYNTIAEAVTAATAGDVIKIAGTHTESITIDKDITLRGTDPATDIIQAAATAGSATSRVLAITGNNVTIENLTIKNGNATVVGGGIFIDNATTLVTLKNLIVEDNASTKNGGGIIARGSNVNIEGCVVRNNTTAETGAGLSFVPTNSSGQNAIVNIKNSLIANNTATKNAGGFNIDGNNSFGNDYKLTVNVENTTIAFNTAVNEGGAIMVKGAVYTHATETNIAFNLNQSTVAYNTTTNGSRHGLYFLQGASADGKPRINLRNSIIALNTGTAGKDINFGGGVTENLTNCVIGTLTNKNGNVTNEANNLLNKANDVIKLATSLEAVDGSIIEVLPIMEGSVAIGAADAGTGTTLDIKGITRDANPDAGAFEYVSNKSTDATLSALTYNGTSVPSFDANTITYAVELASGTTEVPTVDGTLTDSNASKVVNNATALNGQTAVSSTVVVTAEDGSTSKTYTINFTVAAPSTPTWDENTKTWSTQPTATDEITLNTNYTGPGFTCASLTVEAGQTVDVGSGTLDIKGDVTNNGTLIIKSGASLITYAANAFTGTVEVQRNTPHAGAARYSFVGSTVQQDASVTGADLGSFVYQYDETQTGDAAWVNASAEQLVPGRGYTQASKGALSFTGTPNDGNITYTGATNVNDGFNLIANPYPVGLDLAAFLTANTANTTGSVYVWDDNGSDVERGTSADYITMNGTGHTSSSRKGGHDKLAKNGGNIVLGGGQGFFVQLDNGGANTNIFFTEAMRVGGFNADGNFFRESVDTKQTVRLALENSNGLYRETLLGFLDGATDNFDKVYDAKKFGDKASQLYSILEGEKYAIQAFPHISGEKMVALGMDVEEAGSYTIDISEVENIDENTVVELIDTKLNVVHNLSEGAYAFDTDEAVEDTRFVLNVREAVISSLDSKLTEKLEIKASLSGLQLFGNSAYNVSIMDMTGKLLLSQKLNNKAQVSYNFDKNKLYIIKVNGTVKKLIFN